ncbi:MAG: 16S rRNA (guanine(527)-N(7))-methyltransferase RsmG [Fusicatenibacter sp.]|nr:16S rRNA (guanine(527)-N(7))-methyltransferase RsmG [Lachnospiraceae bacterium]MDY2936968.1 16S rRNA (guanine(527)-N(7))-methyltransferase RsmG [Fusicatenibacter sp.]
MSDYNLEGFQNGLWELHVELSEEQIKQFLQYYELLVEWNSFMNLTAITEFDQVITKHFLDSLSVVKVCEMDQIGKVLDVGTGAGFPGIPLKIAFPELEIVLLDSLNKRVKFLDEVIQRLGLKGIRAVHGRAEEFVRTEGAREGFDLVVSRAVANLSSLSEYCLPYVKVGGSFISYKSGKVKEELAAAEKAVSVLGGAIENTVYFQLTGTEDERSFVCIRKKKETPKKYPRKAGLPGKEPIGAVR